MHIAKGTTRVVVCFPEIALVIKIAKPKPFSLLSEVWCELKFSYRVRKWRRLRRLFFCQKEDDILVYTLLNGIWQNRLERRMWRSTSSSFLEPTYFSFFGLVNIQRFGNELTESFQDSLWWQLCELTNEEVFGDGHHFSNPSNFSYRNGHIRMTDYGGSGVWEIVEKYGDIIVKRYNPSYERPTPK